MPKTKEDHRSSVATRTQNRFNEAVSANDADMDENQPGDNSTGAGSGNANMIMADAAGNRDKQDSAAHDVEFQRQLSLATEASKTENLPARA